MTPNLPITLHDRENKVIRTHRNLRSVIHYMRDTTVWRVRLARQLRASTDQPEVLVLIYYVNGNHHEAYFNSWLVARLWIDARKALKGMFPRDLFHYVGPHKQRDIEYRWDDKRDSFLRPADIDYLDVQTL